MSSRFRDNWRKQLGMGVFVVIALGSLIGGSIAPAFAQTLSDYGITDQADVDLLFGNEVPTRDQQTRINTGAVIPKNATANLVADLSERNFVRRAFQASGIAVKSALHYLLNTLAYDTATWLATGAAGEQPMFYTDSWGDYLAKTVDSAGGLFVEKWGQALFVPTPDEVRQDLIRRNTDLRDTGKIDVNQWEINEQQIRNASEADIRQVRAKNYQPTSIPGFNLCAPNLTVNIRLGLGLDRLRKPRGPRCTFTQMVNNWEQELTSPNFLDKFNVAFDPEQNDIGISLNAFEQYIQVIGEEKEAATKTREEGQGFMGVVSKVSKKIFTPAQYSNEQARLALQKGTVGSETLWGDIAADSINTFTSTLAGKLFEQLFKKGLAALRGGSADSSSGSSGSSGSSVVNSGSTGRGLFANANGAQDRFISFLDSGIPSSGPYDVLQKLTICLNPTKPGPDECVIDQSLRTAIDRELTVREALAQGLLKGDAPFGFDAQGFEPRYNEGYPYRSLIILRTHSIIPVGWELAAQAINRFGQGKTYSLRDVVNNFSNDNPNDPSSMFFGLVDPDWVLKSPQAFCKAEGYGEGITSDNVVGGTNTLTGDNSPAQRQIARANYCADYQSCISEAPDGSCRYFGYCTEEERIWNPAGEACAPEFSSCRTFTNPAGTTVSYLQSSLNYNGCNIDNAGCQWYCTQADVLTGRWTCAAPGEDVIKACQTPGGCPVSVSCSMAQGQTSCTNAAQQVNLSLSTACSSGSRWWNGSACAVSIGCTIPKDGVSCTTQGCEGKPNLLKNFSFEQSAPAPALADSWTEITSAPVDYFQRAGTAGDKVFSGRNSLRLFSVGGSVQPTVISAPITITRGVEYSFSGYVYNQLNLGNISVQIVQGNAYIPITTGDNVQVVRRSSLHRTWEQLSMDFSLPAVAGEPAQTTVQIAIVAGDGAEQVSGTAWFDNFALQERCIADQATLTLSGNVGKDGSKLHLDRDAQSCDPTQAGCSEFLTLGARLDQNLFSNAEFTQINPGSTADDATPDQFAGVIDSASVRLLAVNDPQRNDVAMKVERAAGADAFVAVAVTPSAPAGLTYANRTFFVSFLAKASSGAGFGTCDREKENGWGGCLANSSTNYIRLMHTGTSKIFGNIPMAGLNDIEWKRFSTVVTIPPYGFLYCNAVGNASDPANWRDTCAAPAREGDSCGGGRTCQGFLACTTTQQSCGYGAQTGDSCGNGGTCQINDRLELIVRPPEADGSYVLYDDVQMIELDSPNISLNPSAVHPLVTGSTMLRKPPASLECRGYTADRPSPYVLQGITKNQCVGERLVWKKTCGAGDLLGAACDTDSDCFEPNPQTGVRTDESGTAVKECVAASCDPSDTYCCHDVDAGACFGSRGVSYAMYCSQDEVGCNAYSPVGGGTAIPAVVGREDACPAECVGYAAYKQSPSVFESADRIEYFIPQTARQCTAAQAGCTEFTNLDEVAQGGEGREYYQYVRLCVKPEDAGASCQTYYAWEGSDETGFQLKTYDLSGGPDGPRHAISDPTKQPTQWGNCASAEDARTNPFCRELLDASGTVRYEILENTVSCSVDCHPYRKTSYGSDAAVDEADCAASNGTWQDGACIYQAIPNQGLSCAPAASGCREFRGNSGANIFTALQDSFEDGDSFGWTNGTIASAALSVGGHSLRSQNGVVTSLVATYAGGAACSINDQRCDATHQENCYDPLINRCIAAASGQRCSVNVGQTQCGTVGASLVDGGTYVVSMWLRSAGATSAAGVPISLAAGANVVLAEQAGIAPEWRYVEFGPITVGAASPATALTIGTNNGPDFFVDNIQIRQISNYVYAIKNSWQTPASCDTNPYITPPQAAPQFMLGCQQYRTPENQTVTLHQFDHLCRQEAVGCEAVIDTFNSSSLMRQTFNAGDPIADTNVPADKVTYIVDRPEFRCSADVKGCQLVGQPTTQPDGTVVGYNTVAVINNPDRYDQILCGSDAVGCQEFTSNTGSSFFKDPGNKTCEYKTLASGTTGWYKTGTTEPCPSIRSPLGDVHPSDGWAGVCPAEANSCTAYIDPTSSITKNILLNPDFGQDIDNNGTPDGWNLTGNVQPGELRQRLNLQPNTVYTVSFTNGANTEQLNSLTSGQLAIGIYNCPGILSYDNSLVPDAASGSFVIPFEAYGNDWTDRPQLPSIRSFSGRFTSPADGLAASSCELRLIAPGRTIQALVGNSDTDQSGLIDSVMVGKTGTYYRLASTVDAVSCNGIVDPVNGCVLFNNRGNLNYHLASCIAGLIGRPCTNNAACNTTATSNDGICSNETDTSYLAFDADVSGPTVNSGVPVPASIGCAGNCDSDTILKVRPDRQCGEWLSCQTKIKQADSSGNLRDYCLELRSCNSLDANGNCNSFVLPNTQTVNANPVAPGQPFNLTARRADAKALANLSGYSHAGITFADVLGLPPTPFASANTIAGYYPYGLMAQVGEAARVPDGSFDLILSQNPFPLGWNWENPTSEALSTNVFQVLSDSVAANRTDGIRLLGRASLKVVATSSIISDLIDVFPNTSYSLSGSINTLNLQPQGGTGTIEAVDENGASFTPPARISLGSRLDWRNQTVTFTTRGNSSYVRIRLVAGGVAPEQISGATYYDNISLQPTLQIQDVTANGTTSTQTLSRSCRMYPESSALACTYIDDSGVLRRGWEGFCLERDPRNPDICLQWLPVDILKGDLADETNYNGRSPLYYCASEQETSKSSVSSSKNTTELRIEQGDGVCSAPVVFTVPYLNESFRVLDYLTISGTYVKFTGDSADDPRVIAFRDDGTLKNADFADAANQRYMFYGEGDTEGRSDLVPLMLNEGTPNEKGFCDGVNTSTTGSRGSCEIPPNQFASCATDRSASCSPEGCGFGPHSVFVHPVFDRKTQTFTITIAIGHNANDNRPVGADGWTVKAYYKGAYCTQLIQVVTPSGRQRTWFNRLKSGSSYIVPLCTAYNSPLSFLSGTASNRCIYSTDLPPFGSAKPATPADDPTRWDSVPDIADKQPVYRLFTDVSGSQAARFGQSYPVTGDRSPLQRLFAQTYGVWKWQDADSPAKGERGTYVFVPPGSADPAAQFGYWNPPSTLCDPSQDNQRPDYVAGSNADICAVAPRVTNISLNGNTGGAQSIVNRFGAGQATITFNTVIDKEQLPLTAYRVDWGDTSISSASGAALRDRSNPESAYILSHSYDYFRLLINNTAGDGIYCYGETPAQRPRWATLAGVTVQPNQCVVKPRVQIYDNWGWCNADLGTTATPPGAARQYGFSSATTPTCTNNDAAWSYFPGYVIVGLE